MSSDKRAAERQDSRAAWRWYKRRHLRKAGLSRRQIRKQRHTGRPA